MSKIYKYSLMLDQIQTSSQHDWELSLPKGASILSVGVQGDQIVLWAIVDPHAGKESRSFLIVGTGWDAPDLTKYHFIGTVQIGWFVWHVFERCS